MTSETMTIEFTRWPQQRAQAYRDLGYWLDQPLTGST
jgi:2,3-dihydroxybenzoate-AMP ligase